MAASATDKFKKSYAFLQKTLSSSIDNVTTTIPLSNATNIPTDTAVDFIIDRVDANGNRTTSSREIVTGVVSGTNIINAVRGQQGTTAQSHSAGAVVEFNISAQTHNDMVDGLLAEHTQAGLHTLGSSSTLTSTKVITGLNDTNGNKFLRVSPTASAVNDITITNAATGGTPDISASGSDSNISITLTPKGTGQITHTKRSDGWVTGLPTPNTVTYNGNRSYSVVINSTDLTGYISPGMRLRTTRTVTAPTQCTSLNGTTQYWSNASPAGMIFTTTCTGMAWVKLTQYGANSMIISRHNGTNGYLFFINSTGQVSFQVATGAAYTSYQAIPLNKWVHVAASYNAGTVVTYIDGVVASGTGSPSASITQAGNLEIGAYNGATNPFPGKIAQAAIFNAVIAQATIQGYISQGLAGNETSLISAYSFNNSFNDLNANANNLTANGSAVATNSDSPFAQDATATPIGTNDYGIVTKTAFSTNTTLTVQVPEGCAIPTTGGVSSLAYSVHKSPNGFPASLNRWVVEFLARGDLAQASPVSGTWYNVGESLSVPIGAWKLAYEAVAQASSGANVPDVYSTLSTANNSESDSRFSIRSFQSNPTNNNIYQLHARSNFVDLTSSTTYYLNLKCATASMSQISHSGSVGATSIRAELTIL